MEKIYKFIIILLVSSFLISNMHLGIFIKAVMPDVVIENKENEDVDLSLIPNVLEVEEKRTKNSKTYKKENGMYETKYYKEQIHYKDKNNNYIEIDNTLKLENEQYTNTDNAYKISLPKTLSKNKSISITYNNEQLNIYYETNKNIPSVLSNKIQRNVKNLKDEISYKLNNLETVEYIIKQDSIKENIILNEYIKEYSYSYFIETTLNIEKIDNKLLFKNNNNEIIFIMNEYYMYDSNDNTSYDIDYTLEQIKDNIYKIIVSPNDEFLKDASYPVTIDPEINFGNSGFTGGIGDVYSVDLLTNETTYLNDGTFSINNRNKDNPNDDLIAYLEFYMPSDYTIDVGNTLKNNQFMYAYLTLPTYNTNVTGNTKVNLNLVDSLNDTTKTPVDSETIENNNNFNHKFNIYEAFKENVSELINGSTSMLFELSLEGNSNSNITYSLYGNMSGTPVISVGYLDDAGLNDYYTYESLPMNDESSFYIAHNSGNLTYIYNTYNDKNLINLSHIYNVNRRNINSPYGKGFNINYNEKITGSSSVLTLTKGDYSTTIYNEISENNYLSTDGTNSLLTKVYDENNNLIEYVIKELSGGLKKYDSDGKLIKIYPNYKEESVYVTLTYDNKDRISVIKDSYNNELILNYSTFDTTDEYLFGVEVKKYDPTIEADFKYVYPTVMVFNYNNGKITDITEDYQLYITDDTVTYIEYDTNTRINKVHKNNIGYTFIYDEFNRIEQAKIYSSLYNNGNYLEFEYSSNGYKTIINNGVNDITSYSFDKYYHTISIETNDGYTTFYKYEDIYYDDEGNYILEPNYNLNHKVITQSNYFKNVYNPVNNHGFEVLTTNGIYSWASSLSNNSNATINTSEYLFGSKVLEIDNKVNSSYVYQDVYVESGKTYIISGYIKNTNLTNGAYIDVSSIDAIITNIEKDNYIVNEKEFVRYECKFNTTTSGFIRIKLVNSSIGKAYFDNIQLNTNYVDTRYNYLSNSSFENGMSGWTGENIYLNINDYFNDECHNQSLKLDINGTVSQTISIIGEAGDTFVFGGYSFYQNYTGKVKVKLILFNELGVESKEFIFDNNDINSTYMMNKLTATTDYYQIRLEITNLSNSSIAYIDNMAIYKEGYGINVTYNEEGLIEEEYNEITDKTTTNEYDEENNLTKVTTDDTTIEAEYDENNRLDLIKEENVTTTFERDEKGNITSIKSSNDGIKVYDHGSSSYTPDGLFPLTSTDVLGNTETKTYSYLTGLINLIVDEKGVETAYIYDKDDNLLNVTSGKNSNYKSITYTYDVTGLLTSIIQDNITYSFTYNNYNDVKTIKINNDTILTNNYNNEDGTGVYVGELNETVYSYGTVSFDYDDEHRIKSIYYNNTKVLEYTYNDYGEIASYIDYKENVTYYYNYDYQNRLINVKTSNGNNITYTYNDDSLLTSIDNKNGLNTYEYDEKDYLIEENISDNKYKITYSYSTDSFKQLNVISYYLSNNQIAANYTYEKNTVNGKDIYTGRIKKIEYTGINNKTIRYEYTYDSNSNITKILGYTNNTLTYEENNTYDIFNQLASQSIDIEDVNHSYNYYYDTKGNITSYLHYEDYARTNEASFTYNAKNELTKAVIDGKTYNITYSSTGQPNKYFDWDITYDMRSIKTLSKDENNTIEYSYNANGVRISKEVTINGITTNVEYVLNGTNIIEETRTTGSVTETLQYHYDSNNSIIGFTYNGEKYLYLKNIQNDIIGIIDENNNLVVEYNYDGYGNIIQMIDNTTNKIGEKNPYRYRSYFYDTETNLFLVSSRYYSPKLCRWISPDDIEYLDPESVNGLNLYCYCLNNPIMYIDPDGHSPKWLDCLLIAGMAAAAIALTIVSCGSASAAIAPLAFAYFGIAANTTLAITTAAAVVTSVGIAAFAVADIQSVTTDGGSNYLSFLGGAYDGVKSAFYFSSSMFGYAGQFAQPGWGRETRGKTDAPQYSHQYGKYIKETPKGNDVTIYNGRGQAIIRYDSSHIHYGMQSHTHYIKWWIYNKKWRWDGPTGTVESN